jgi:2-polyprenyl-3-methyl-5-hydroxy-6-metoxy-1,4-benzoquinol methylase
MTEARYDRIVGYYISDFAAIDDSASLALLDLAGPVDGQAVLDLACGHGRISRELARRGAIVTGADLSAALLARAAELEEAEPLGIRYVHADVAAPGWLERAGLGKFEFDVVTCNFGLSDIDDLDGALRTAAAALKPGGRFVFSILHPCFPGGTSVSASWPTGATYYDEGFWTADAEHSPLRRQVGANHRMIATYLNALRRHDLWLDEVREPRHAREWSAKRDEAARYPVHFAARCLSRPGPGGA